ncbi:MAG: DUF6456 domain-containing protein [Hyphomicrobiales bacterium]|nr:DUF6456 domain-containing protein [Hyphomicrobiales bacterium]
MNGAAPASARILRFLSHGPAAVADAVSTGRILLENGNGTISVDRNLLAALAAQGAIVHGAGRIALQLPDDFRPPDNHRDMAVTTVGSGATSETVAVNHAESPLAQLMRRRSKDGKSFLTQPEFQAGERLRSDYTRGQIMPRLGANWVACVASGRRDGGIADLTETALAARMRVERALQAVGPELSGVLIDVCCFLKGMEAVEMERSWPIRSAKVVLKAGLAVLARHYNPKRGQPSGPFLHWGAADYRPTIG